MKWIQTWEQNPSPIGLIAGFFALPILWLAQESVLRLATNTASPPPDKIFVLFILGAVPGAILGAGTSRAMAAYRHGNSRGAKWNLLGFGGALSAITLILLFVFAARNPGFISSEYFFLEQRLPPYIAIFLVPLIAKNFPFHCAFLMFCIGLFMRSRR